jgi:hypothetical protein
VPVKKAKDYYLGRNNRKRLNCAQSVLAAFKDQYGISEQAIEAAVSQGSGNAPGGVCGAYCAARQILEQYHLEKAEDFEHYFHGLAGSLDCKEIRKLRKLSCLGCVTKAAEYIATQSKKC